MNHKERFFRALELGEPDYVPITDFALDPPIVEQVLGRPIMSQVYTTAAAVPAGIKR